MWCYIIFSTLSQVFYYYAQRSADLILRTLTLARFLTKFLSNFQPIIPEQKRPQAVAKNGPEEKFELGGLHSLISDGNLGNNRVLDLSYSFKINKNYFSA